MHDRELDISVRASATTHVSARRGPVSGVLGVIRPRSTSLIIIDIVIILCMYGTTLLLMHDGSQRVRVEADLWTPESAIRIHPRRTVGG